MSSDELIFDPTVVFSQDLLNSPTKRAVVSALSRFYDPFGILSPVIITFKVFLQELTKSKIDWNQPLTGSPLEKWKLLVSGLCNGLPITITRVYFNSETQPDSYHLCGFCDASVLAFAAVVYLVITSGTKHVVKFVTSKTRVAPPITQTIPRL